MICRALRTIFVHIPKTGGQSVTYALLDAIGRKWTDDPDLGIMTNRDPLKGPEQIVHLFADEYVPYGWVSNVEFKTFFKFSIVRNPYERLVSEYKFNGAEREGVSFADFVLEYFPGSGMSDRRRHVEPQWRFVCNPSGALIVDQILKFESLAQEMRQLFPRILGRTLILPHINGSRDRREANAFFDARTEAFVWKFYRRDFETFGYQRMR
jgi:hypothetical protein